MKHIFKKLVVYAAVLIAVFFLVPIVTMTGVPKEFLITLLFVVNPVACLGTGAVFGIKHGFKWYFLLLAPVLFIPSIFIFYNDSALVYSAVYLLSSAAGLAIGCILRKPGKH